jgi:hypothetical protein
MSVELWGQGVEEVAHTSTEFDRDISRVGGPIGADEELFRVPLFITVGKKHLDVDVLLKVIRALLKFGRARGMLGLDAEVKSKYKQGPVVGWRSLVGTVG